MEAIGYQVERSVENLWQCMAQSKRPLGLLLGAGCPASIQVDGRDGDREPLIPAIDGLTRRIEKTVDLPPGLTPYDDVTVWIRAASRSYPVSVFTTNYDILLETALERRDVPCFDGFVGVHEPFIDITAIEQDSLPDRWARVWKLHGSANWALLPSGKVVRKIAEDAAGTRLIHPSHLKYDESRRMPYLVMQDRLRQFLKEPSATLSTIGYSFEDEHINELIVQGIQGNPGAMVFALQ